MDAILGTTVKVTTLGGDGLGEVDLKIPAGTQPGTTLVMSKRGVPKLGQSGARGDHLVHVKVRGGLAACAWGLPAGVSALWAAARARALGLHQCRSAARPPPPLQQVKIPKTISGDERKLMEQLRELQASKPAASGGRGWFS